MFIGHDHNTHSYCCQYANVFASGDTFSYIAEMRDMREILVHLMTRAGDDAYSLQTKSGVPQPTTQRFLAGKHGDPRSTTVKKWAKVYGVTESQLRGDTPIDGLNVKKEKSDDQARVALTREEEKILSIMTGIDKEALDALMKLGTILAKREGNSNATRPMGRLIRSRGAPPAKVNHLQASRTSKKEES